MKRILTTALAATVAAGALHAAASGIAPGATAPAFELPDLDGNVRSLASFRGSYVVLEWTNYDCPFVKKHYETGNIPALQKKLAAEGVVWLSICSSAPGKQGHFTPEQWRTRMAAVNAVPKAVLLDTDGRVGRLYNARNTPYMLVLDPEGKILYVGAIDNQPGTDPALVGGALNYVMQALTEARAGKPVSVPAVPAYGCTVKY